MISSACRDELQAFFDVHHECGSHPGNIHLEMTGNAVTEFLSDDNGSLEMEGKRGLATRYETHCDPRLNVIQSLELAFFVAGKMRLDWVMIIIQKRVGISGVLLRTWFRERALFITVTFI